MDDIVLPDADQLRLRPDGGCQGLLDCCVAENGTHVAIKGTGRAATLHMAQYRDTDSHTEALFQYLFHIVAGDGVALAILSPFGDDHDAVPATAFASRLQSAAHLFLPILHVGRAFGDEDPVGAGGQGTHQGQVATMAAHDLDDKGPLMAGCGAGDGIDGLCDPMQGSVGTDGHVGAEHVIVDRAHQTDNGQLRVSICISLADLLVFYQLGQQIRPLLAEDVGSSQAAVAANHDQAVDVVLHQVPGCPAPSFAGAELCTPG